MNAPTPLAARVILCEQGRKWATVLKRSIVSPIYQTRFDDAIFEALAASPYSVVIRETSVGSIASAIDFAFECTQRFPEATAIAVGAGKIIKYESVLLEAGYQFVCASLRKTQPIARMVGRQLAAAPAIERTFRQSVYDRLPWN